MAKLTRGPGGEGTYCYYYLEDGECSLDNPVIWGRLTKYIIKTISFTSWIYNKTAVDPIEVIANVAEDLKTNNPNYPHDITYLIGLINTQIGREWWKYLKVSNPAYYNRCRSNQIAIMLRGQKEGKYKPSPEAKKYIKEYNRSQVKELTNYYLAVCVKRKLERETGMNYTTNEVLEDFPDLIEETRENITAERKRKAIIESEKLIAILNGTQTILVDDDKEIKRKSKIREYNKKQYERAKEKRRRSGG